VDAHPHAEQRALRPSMSCERLLCRYRAGGRVLGPRKRKKESVTLCIDLTAVVFAERCAEQASVLGKGLCIALAKSVEQTRGSLDVRKEETDRPHR
jgi:hypothetical protein